jgi:hypothetical protein
LRTSRTYERAFGRTTRSFSVSVVGATVCQMDAARVGSIRQRTVTSVSMSLPSRVLKRRSSFSFRSPSSLAVMTRLCVDVSYVVQSLIIGAKKYVAPGSAISVECVTLLNFTPTCVAPVVCGVHAESAVSAIASAMSLRMAVLNVRPACRGRWDRR